MFEVNKVDFRKVAVLMIINMLVLAHCIDVNITSSWIPELGWQVNCTWRVPLGDRLQSVHLHKDEKQFLIYRPETNGLNYTHAFPTPANNMSVNCVALVDDTGEGQCSLLIELYQPPEDQMQFLCEVSGERPWFREGNKDYIIQTLVLPSNATVVVSTQATNQNEQSPPRRTFNCSSSGLPAPNLVWTVGEQNIKADFTGRMWNASTKLWDVWSFLSATMPDHTVTVVCSPESSSGRGQAAEYTLHNDAATRCGNTYLLGLGLSTVAGIASILLR